MKQTRAQRQAALVAEAQDPATAPDRLRELATAAGPHVVKAAVVQNPNTPRATLLKLAGRYWEAFLQNPVLPLLLLEDPGLPNRLPLRVLRGLVRREDVPTYILRTLTRHSDREVREGAKYHTGLAAETGTPETDWHETVRQELEKLPATQGHLPEALVHQLVPDWLVRPLAGTHNFRLRQAIIRAGQEAGATEALREVSDLLRRAAGERQQERRFSAHGWGGYWHNTTVGRGRLSEADLTRLATGSPTWQLLAARSPNLTPPLLEQLARSPHPRVWHALARHRRLTPVAAATLATRNDAHTLLLLARNRATPGALLATISRTASADIRVVLGRHHHTPPATLAALATDSDERVREAVAANRYTPEATLDALTRDPNPTVRAAFSRNRAATAAMFERLVTDPDRSVRQALAKSYCTPHEVHRRLVLDDERKVRRDAVYNSRRTPRRILDFMLGKWNLPSAELPPLPRWKPTDKGWDSDRRTGPHLSAEDQERRGIVHSGQATQAQLAEWALSENVALRMPVGWYLTDPVLLARLAQDKRAVRAAVAHNKKAPPELLATLATDRKVSVRRMVAGNPAAPPAALAVLATDAKRRVRLAAAGNPAVPAEAFAAVWARDRAKATHHEWQSLLRNPHLDPNFIAETLATGDEDSQRLLMRNPALTPDQMRHLVETAPPAAVDSLTYNPATPADVLLALGRQSKPSAYHLVRHPNASVDLLRLLAAHDDPSIAAEVARCPFLTAELFEQLLPLMKAPDILKRLISFSSDAPHAFVFEAVMREGDRDCLHHLATNEHTPVAILLSLAQQPQPDANARNDMGWRLARNPASTNEVLNALVDAWQDKPTQRQVRWWFDAIAEHPNASPALLERLTRLVGATTKGKWRHPTRYEALYDEMALNLALNPRLAPELLPVLADHPTREVRYAVLQRPDCPPQLKAKMRAAALQRSLETGNSLLGRTAALADAATKEDWLRYLYPQARWLERLAMVENPNLPADLLQQLAQDAHRLVRAAAQERLQTGRIPDLTVSTA